MHIPNFYRFLYLEASLTEWRRSECQLNSISKVWETKLSFLAFIQKLVAIQGGGQIDMKIEVTAVNVG